MELRANKKETSQQGINSLSSVSFYERGVCVVEKGGDTISK